MTKTLSIQLKAAFPLIIFSFNMVVGFACALGVEIVINTSHHQEEVAEMHGHGDKEKNHHEEAEHKHSHKDGKGDGCCTDRVIKIAKADKAAPQIDKLVNPVFFTAFIATYYNINISYPSQVSASNKYFVRGHHPPIPDIRIAIQSFQI